MKTIDEKDMRAIREIAEKYELDEYDLCLAVAKNRKPEKQTKGRKLQIRVSGAELSAVLRSIAAYKKNYSGFGAFAVQEFMRLGVSERNKYLPEIAESGSSMGSGLRNRKYQYRFGTREEELEFFGFCRANNFEVSRLVRFCVLRYNGKDFKKKS